MAFDFTKVTLLIRCGALFQNITIASFIMNTTLPFYQATSNTPFILPPGGRLFTIPSLPVQTAQAQEIEKKIERIFHYAHTAILTFNAQVSEAQAKSLLSKLQKAQERVQNLRKKDKTSTFDERLHTLSVSLQQAIKMVLEMQQHKAFWEIPLKDHSKWSPLLTEIYKKLVKSVRPVEEVPIEAMQKLTLLEGESPTVNIAAYWQRVDGLITKGNFEAVSNDLLQIIHLQPNDSRAYLTLGAYYGFRTMYWQAYRYLKRGIELDPNCPAEIHYYKAVAAMHLCDCTQSANELWTALRKDPQHFADNPSYGFLLGKIKFFQKKYSEAQRFFSGLRDRNDILTTSIPTSLNGLDAILCARRNQVLILNHHLSEMSQRSHVRSQGAYYITRGIIHLEAESPAVRDAHEEFVKAETFGIDSDAEVISWFLLNDNLKPVEDYFAFKIKTFQRPEDHLRVYFLQLIAHAPNEDLKMLYIAAIQNFPRSSSDIKVADFTESARALLEQNLVQSLSFFRQGLLHKSRNTPITIKKSIVDVFEQLQKAVRRESSDTATTLMTYFEEEAGSLLTALGRPLSEEEGLTIGTYYLFSKDPKRALVYFSRVAEANPYYAPFKEFVSYLINGKQETRYDNVAAVDFIAYFVDILISRGNHARDTMLSLVYMAIVSTHIIGQQDTAPAAVRTLFDLLQKSNLGLPGYNRFYFYLVTLLVFGCGIAVERTLRSCLMNNNQSENNERQAVLTVSKIITVRSDKDVISYIWNSLVEMIDKGSTIGLKLQIVSKSDAGFYALINCDDKDVWAHLNEADCLNKYIKALSHFFGPVTIGKIENLQYDVRVLRLGFKETPAATSHEQERLKDHIETMKALDASVLDNICIDRIRKVLIGLFQKSCLSVTNVCKFDKEFKAFIDCSNPNQWKQLRTEAVLADYAAIVSRLLGPLKAEVIEDGESGLRRWVFRFTQIPDQVPSSLAILGAETKNIQQLLAALSNVKKF